MDALSGNELFLELKHYRETKGISLEDIARKYRMQIRYLEALEEGKLQELPAAYDHLFFRSYLKALALDEEEYMEHFYLLRNRIRNLQQPQAVPGPPPSSEKSGKWEKLLDVKSILKSKNFLVFLPFLLIVIILIVLLSSTQNVQTEVNAPVREIDVQSIAASLQPPAPVDTVDSLKLNEKKLNLMIQGLRNTWFRLVLDKHDTAEYLLKRGNQMSAKAAETFEFVIGRADGLQFTMNNKPPQRISTDSVIVSYLLIDSSGIVARRFKQLKPVAAADSIAAAAADSLHEDN